MPWQAYDDKTDNYPQPGDSAVEISGAESEVVVATGRRGSADLDPIAIGSILANKYRLERVLGRGGMGQVFLGMQLSLDLPVAVKVMLPTVASDPVLVRRFEREARAMSALRHQNIVQVLDYGVHGQVPFLVMEFLVGQPLSLRLHARGGWLSLPAVDAVMQGLFDAFELAHGQDIIHRDLKPDNIFLAQEPGGREVVKVLDFGLAHMKDPKGSGPTLTRADMVSGTPEYMCPEQCRSLKVGSTADLYAIGCVLTEMLQGRPPFEGASSVDVMTKQMFYEPPPLRRPAQADPVPPAVEKLRVALLSKRASNRPADINTLRELWNRALDPDAADLPIRHDSEAPMGTRGQRAPSWNESEPPREDAETAEAIGLIRLSADQQGVDESCIMGLRAHQIDVKEYAPHDPIPAATVVVLDVGADLEPALQWLTQRAGQPIAGVLICGQSIGADQMGSLIAAGAGEVMGYPIAPDTLRRKVRRLLRRAARGRAH